MVRKRYLRTIHALTTNETNHRLFLGALTPKPITERFWLYSTTILRAHTTYCSTYDDSPQVMPAALLTALPPTYISSPCDGANSPSHARSTAPDLHLEPL